MKNMPKAGDTVEIEMYVHQETSAHMKRAVYLAGADMSVHGYPCLGKTTVTFTMPDGDAVKAMVTALEAEIKTERANHHVKITQLEDKIQQLLAIGHDGGVE